MGSRYLDWRLCASESEENADLYSSLSGDGGGTYGVVWSLTSKTHVDIPVSGANLTFSSEDIMTDTYYAALTAWHKNLPKLVNTGAMTIYYVTSAAFILTPFTGPGIPASKAKELLQPFVDELNILEIAYNVTGPTDFPTYLDEFNTFQLPLEVSTAQYGGRLILRSVVEKNTGALTAAIPTICEQGSAPLFVGVGLNVNFSIAGNVENAVLPAWRDTLIDSVVTT